MSIQEVVCGVYFDSPGVWAFRITKAELEKNTDEQLGQLMRARLGDAERRQEPFSRLRHGKLTEDEQERLVLARYRWSGGPAINLDSKPIDEPNPLDGVRLWDTGG